MGAIRAGLASSHRRRSRERRGCRTQVAGSRGEERRLPRKEETRRTEREEEEKVTAINMAPRFEPDSEYVLSVAHPSYVFSHTHARHVLKQTKLRRPWRFKRSGTGVHPPQYVRIASLLWQSCYGGRVPPVRNVQPTHGRDARVTTA